MKVVCCITLSFVALAVIVSAHGEESLLLHRWGFNGDLTDSVGGQTAWSTNTSFVAVGGGYAVKTEGGTNGTSYVNLGSNILPRDGRSFTFELWVRLDTWENAEYRMFTIGSSVGNKFDQTWGNKDHAGDDYTLVTSSTQNKYVVNEFGIGPHKVGTFCHLAYVFTPAENGHWLVRVYRHGAGIGFLQAATSFLAPHGWKPSTLDQTSCNLARSPNNSHNDSQASFDEIRVWGRALSEREIAASALAGPDAVIPDGDSPFGKTVYDTATGLLSFPAGQTFADGAAKLSAGILVLSGDNSALSLFPMYDGTIAQAGGSFAATDKRIAIGEGLCGIAAFTAMGGAELNVRGVAGNGLGEVVLNDATLRLSGETATPTLVHRWSFNGDLSDSVGGQTASQTGCDFVELGAGQGIKLSGGNHGTTCVDLGSNVLPADGNGATIELWARQDSANVDNVRMLDFGDSTIHAILMGWRSGGANTDFVIVRYSPQPQALTLNELTPYSVGTMYHIALTVSQNGDGTWTVCAYKQDVKSGATLKATTFTAPSGWSLANFVQTHAYLGRAFDGDNTKDADATYDEVRIWNGVLTEAQLSASAVAGPDAPCGGEVKSGTATVGGVTVKVGASGAAINTNGKDVEVTARVSSLADGLVHRWSFNGDLSDGVGGMTATASGYSFVDLGGGKAIKLTGGAKNVSCVDLGAWIIPTNGVGATVELWGRNDRVSDSARMFDIGNSMTNSIMMCWTSSADVNTDLLLIRYDENLRQLVQTLTLSELAPYVVGTEYHIAATYSQTPDGSWIVRAYKQNLATGITEKRSVLLPPSGWTIDKVIQEHAYLGRAFDRAADSAATYDEVRIYNRALSEAELMASAAAGPDADLSAGTLVKTGLGTLTLCGTNTLACPLRVETGVVRTAIDGALSTNSVVELCAGTLLDLGGRSVVAGGLTGGGAAVSNGTLSVTRTICPTGEIVLDGVDVRGTLEVTSGSGTLRRVNGVLDLSGIDLDVKSTSPAGQTVIECTAGFTGDFATVAMPANRRLARSATTVRVVRPGLIIFVK